MPADRGRTGTGSRRQGQTEPERADDRNAELERQHDGDATREAEGALFDRGRQPGAHGTDTPHREIKPGTRSALEEGSGT
jgi:hypothetical protein